MSQAFLLEFCGEKPENESGSSSWLTPAFWIASLSVPAGGEALRVIQLLRWWHRDFRGGSIRETNGDRNGHTISLLSGPACRGWPELFVAYQLYLTPVKIKLI